MTDWEEKLNERSWEENRVELPAYPRQEDRVEFFVSSANPFRFFVDRASLSIGTDGVVRYTLIARSTSGSESVSYEGIRCKSGIHKVYAYGRTADRAWVPSRGAQWREIETRSVNRQHNALQRDYFCPQRIPILTPEEGIDALKRGGHPNARGQMGNN